MKITNNIRSRCRLLMAALLVAALGILAACPVRSASAAFTVTDTDFVGGVYNLSYFTETNTLFKNGVNQGTSNPAALFLSNSGNTANPAWEGPKFEGTVKYLQAPGAFGGFGSGTNSTWNTSANATMGWDFSSITGQIAKIEIRTGNFLFSFLQWATEAAGDKIFADIATPAVFGTGTFTNVYTYTGPNLPDFDPGLPGAVGEWERDLTPSLSSTWLSNPTLLELKFGYELLDTDIPGKHLELFRDIIDGSTVPGFMLQVTLVNLDVDSDGDGVDDGDDNCPDVSNPLQEDNDEDGDGDVCDDDDDDDGHLDIADNCPLDSNPFQGDNDGDGDGDVCDSDDDNDGVDDVDDNCPIVANPEQEDFDGDGFGDVCEEDADGDGVSSDFDNCEFTPLGDVVDSDGCSIDQLNPCEGLDGPWISHGHYVSSVVKTAQSFREQGLITGKEFGMIISNAANSDCGK